MEENIKAQLLLTSLYTILGFFHRTNEKRDGNEKKKKSKWKNGLVKKNDVGFPDSVGWQAENVDASVI